MPKPASFHRYFLLSFSKGECDVGQYAEGSQPQEEIQEPGFPGRLLCPENGPGPMAKKEKPTHKHQGEQQTCHKIYQPGFHGYPSDTLSEVIPAYSPPSYMTLRADYRDLK
jgi:hypothetical protein